MKFFKKNKKLKLKSNFSKKIEVKGFFIIKKVNF